MSGYVEINGNTYELANQGGNDSSVDKLRRSFGQETTPVPLMVVLGAGPTTLLVRPGGVTTFATYETKDESTGGP